MKNKLLKQKKSVFNFFLKIGVAILSKSYFEIKKIKTNYFALKFIIKKRVSN